MDNFYSFVILLIICVPWLLMPAIYLFAFYNFSQILKKLHNETPDLWQKEGRPIGMLFWKPPNHKASWSDMTTGVLVFKWLFVTPLWANDNQEFLSLFRKMRLAVLFWNLGILVNVLVFAVIVILSS